MVAVHGRRIPREGFPKWRSPRKRRQRPGSAGNPAIAGWPAVNDPGPGGRICHQDPELQRIRGNGECDLNRGSIANPGIDGRAPARTGCASWGFQKLVPAAILTIPMPKFALLFTVLTTFSAWAQETPAPVPPVAAVVEDTSIPDDGIRVSIIGYHDLGENLPETAMRIHTSKFRKQMEAIRQLLRNSRPGKRARRPSRRNPSSSPSTTVGNPFTPTHSPSSGSSAFPTPSSFTKTTWTAAARLSPRR